MKQVWENVPLDLGGLSVPSTRAYAMKLADVAPSPLPVVDFQYPQLGPTR